MNNARCKTRFKTTAQLEAWMRRNDARGGGARTRIRLTVAAERASVERSVRALPQGVAAGAR
jgi:hypothetical protein